MLLIILLGIPILLLLFGVLMYFYDHHGLAAVAGILGILGIPVMFFIFYLGSGGPSLNQIL